MAKYEIKTIVSIFVMMIFVVSQADDSLTPSSTPQISISEIICLGKCALECSNKLGEIQSYVACVVGCGLPCLEVTSNDAYNCATSCAISKSINVNTGIHIFTFIYFIRHCYHNIITNHDFINS